MPDPRPPPRWKLALLTWLGLWPTVTAVTLVVAPLLREQPLPVQTLTVTGLVVPMMVWAITPLLLRGFRRWLQR
jgi:hypothetical protein